MTTSLQLHTWVRRLCTDRFEQWTARYAELHASGDAGHQGLEPGDGYYSDAALRTFPRYNLDRAALAAVEALDPASLGDFEAARATLRSALAGAEDVFTAPPQGEPQAEAIEDERRALVEALDAARPADVSGVAPLPYRRRLTGAEHDSWRSRLRERWGVGDDYWYPLGGPQPAGAEALRASEFEAGGGTARLARVLEARGARRVIELREGGAATSSEVDLAAVGFAYDGEEGFWFDAGLDWIVYASHEDSITLAGDELVAGVRAAVPGLQAFAY